MPKFMRKVEPRETFVWGPLEYRDSGQTAGNDNSHLGSSNTLVDTIYIMSSCYGSFFFFVIGVFVFSNHKQNRLVKHLGKMIAKH